MYRLFLRSTDVTTDARLQKYLSALEINGIAHRSAYWFRGEGDDQSRSLDDYVYSRRAKVGGGLSNLLLILRWNFFLSRLIIINRREIELVHAVDLDTALFSFAICKILKIPYVFDVYDCYADSRSVSGMLGNFIKYYERFIILNADLAILADECRLSQHNIEKYQKNILIVENVPTASSVKSNTFKPLKRSSVLKIGYFGNLESNNRGLEDLLSVLSKLDGVEFHVAGIGALSSFFEKAALEHSFLTFYGPMSHADGMDILQNCDVICGLYYSTVENHKFAAPNKYFEHLMLGRALITSNNTPPGIKVRNFDTGWSVDDGVASLLNIFSEMKNFGTDVFERKGKNAHDIWQTTYSDYFQSTVVNTYVKLCSSKIS